MDISNIVSLQKADDKPIVVEVINEKVFAALELSTYQQVPPGIDEEGGKALANILYNSGLELRATVRFYKSYLPVAVITPIPRSDLLQSFPAELVFELNEAQQRLVFDLRNGVEALSTASLDAISAFREASDTVEWSLGSLILGRVASYKDLLEEIAKGKPIMLRNLSINFLGTIFNMADLGLKGAGVDSVWAKAIVSCGATIVTVAGATTATLTTGPLASIGLMTVIETAGFFSNAIDCGEALTHIGRNLYLDSEEVYKRLIVVNTYSYELPGNNFCVNDDGSADIFDRWNRVNTIRGDDLVLPAGEISQSENGFVGEWERECHDWGFECNFERINENDAQDDPPEHIRSEHYQNSESATVEIKVLG